MGRLLFFYALYLSYAVYFIPVSSMSSSCSGLYDMRLTDERSVVMLDMHMWLMMILSSMDAVLSITVLTFLLSVDANLVTLFSISSCAYIFCDASDFHL